MSVEFDPACSTAQPEDFLQLYVPSLGHLNTKNNSKLLDTEDDCPPLPYWPILHKFSGR